MPRFGTPVLALARSQDGTWRTATGLRGSLALLLALTLITVFAVVRPSVAHAYSCGDSNNLPHCYAYGETAIWGAQGATTKIYMVHLQCSQCGGVNNTPGFVNNDMWLNSSNYTYWIETGYLINCSPLGCAQQYFWADHRPVDCSSCENNHNLGAVPGGDYGQNPTFSIKRSSSNSFHVSVVSPNVNIGQASTSNTMDVNNVQLGQELAGNAGASAPNARYSYRYFWDSSGAYTGIFSSYTLRQNMPPYANYVSGDTDFYTHCC